MRSGDRPGLQNRRAAGLPVVGGFDPHSLPPILQAQIAHFLEFVLDSSEEWLAVVLAFGRSERFNSTLGDGTEPQSH
jgi:hypothetical protein